MDIGKTARGLGFKTAMLALLIALATTITPGTALARDELVAGIPVDDETEIILDYIVYDSNNPSAEGSIETEVTRWGDEGDEGKPPGEWVDAHVKQFDGWIFYGWSAFKVPGIDRVVINYRYYANLDGDNAGIMERMDLDASYENGQIEADLEDTAGDEGDVDVVTEANVRASAELADAKEAGEYGSDDTAKRPAETSAGDRRPNDPTSALLVAITAVAAAAVIAGGYKMARKHAKANADTDD